MSTYKRIKREANANSVGKQIVDKRSNIFASRTNEGYHQGSKVSPRDSTDQLRLNPMTAERLLAQSIEIINEVVEAGSNEMMEAIDGQVQPNSDLDAVLSRVKSERLRTLGNPLDTRMDNAVPGVFWQFFMRSEGKTRRVVDAWIVRESEILLRSQRVGYIEATPNLPSASHLIVVSFYRHPEIIDLLADVTGGACERVLAPKSMAIVGRLLNRIKRKYPVQANEGSVGRSTRRIRSDQPIPQARMQDAIHQLSVDRLHNIKDKGKPPCFTAACEEYGVSPKQVKKHARELADKWRNLSYGGVWKFNDDLGEWEISELSE